MPPNLLKDGEIYKIILYSYSFKRIIGTTNYYLFGESLASVQPIYEHLFMVRGWEVFPPNFTNYTNSTDFKNRSLFDNFSIPIPPLVSVNNPNYVIRG